MITRRLFAQLIGLVALAPVAHAFKAFTVFGELPHVSVPGVPAASVARLRELATEAIRAKARQLCIAVDLSTVEVKAGRGPAPLEWPTAAEAIDDRPKYTWMRATFLHGRNKREFHWLGRVLDVGQGEEVFHRVAVERSSNGLIQVAAHVA